MKYYPMELYPFQFIEVEDNQILGNIDSKPKQQNEIVVHKYFADYII